MAPAITRRRFAVASALALAGARLRSTAQTPTATVAAFERDRILAAAPTALTTQPRSLLDLSATVATLTAAFVLTRAAVYPERIAALLQTWFVDPGTRLPAVAELDRNSLEKILPLAELARALTLLADALPTPTLAAVNAALAATLTWLTTAREPLIARDTKDHRASLWLLLTAALARSQRNQLLLDDCRHRLRRPTLRNQIDAQGRFPQELATPFPFRNTLFNFDLLCAACQSLDTAFDQLWLFELPDAIGLRSAAAFLYPVLAQPTAWPFVADADHFRDLPGRRAGLLFAGLAYKRPEYIALWSTTPAVIPPALAATFPVREPLLWTTRPLHGL